MAYNFAITWQKSSRRIKLVKENYKENYFVSSQILDGIVIKKKEKKRKTFVCKTGFKGLTTGKCGESLKCLHCVSNLARKPGDWCMKRNQLIFRNRPYFLFCSTIYAFVTLFQMDSSSPYSRTNVNKNSLKLLVETDVSKWSIFFFKFVITSDEMWVNHFNILNKFAKSMWKQTDTPHQVNK